MTPTERREAEIEIIRQKKQVTYSYFMQEFGVSRETVRNDTIKLMCSYPIETVRGRYGGGVRICPGYTLGPLPKPKAKTFNPEQLALILELGAPLTGHKLDVFNSILSDFAP